MTSVPSLPRALVWAAGLVLVALLARPASVQTSASGTSAPDRPVLGVAFGGGSARGIAHVGVIRWLDEHHIPIDVAAGTSMGGLIGGAFATGMNADEIQAMLRHVAQSKQYGPPFLMLGFNLRTGTSEQDGLRRASRGQRAGDRCSARDSRQGPRRSKLLNYFRDQQGLEVDFLLPQRNGSVALVECKAARTVMPAMAAPMQRLAEALKKKRPPGIDVKMFLVHRRPKTPAATHAVASGVQAWAWQDFVRQI